MKNLELIHPHDHFFKEVFGNSSDVGSFVKNYLPQNIVEQLNLSSINPHKGTYVDKRLKQYHSDLLYKVQTK